MVADQQYTAPELDGHGEFTRRASRRLVHDYPVECLGVNADSRLANPDARSRDDRASFGEELFKVALR
ncbi:hypothetical protein D9M68_926900 [compost metagenome]